MVNIPYKESNCTNMSKEVWVDPVWIDYSKLWAAAVMSYSDNIFLS